MTAACHFALHTFIIAGETTRYLLWFPAEALADHPDQRRLPRGGPELVANAIDETFRYSPLNWTTCRTATRRVEIADRSSKGRLVVLAYVSANRDEDVWDRPDHFDVTRRFDQDHLWFGYGRTPAPAPCSRGPTRP